jgi:benzoyl-CoA reductase subunit C
MELGMTGHLEPLDGLLFSSICDSARNLAFVMKRNFPQMYVDFLHLPQNPGSPASVDFLAEEYARLARELEQMGGAPVTSESLQAAIRLYNRNRTLVRQLYALRSASPHRVTAREAYLLVRAGYFLPVEEHNAILEQALAALPARKGKLRDSLRIVIEGAFCEQPPLDLIRLVEDAGCYVVDDDFVLGRNWFLDDVATDAEPLLALARAYAELSRYSSVRHDFRHPRWEALADKVRRTRADAVIFLIAKFCEPAYFDYVLYKKKLEEMGTPHLLLEFEEKMFTFERMRMEVETFVESLVFD